MFIKNEIFKGLSSRYEPMKKWHCMNWKHCWNVLHQRRLEMPGYELTTLTKENMKSIAQYTIETWEREQEKRYEALLSKRFQEIAQGIIMRSIFLKRRPGTYFSCI